ncbi:MAG: VWA domain-containing protein, partial [Acidobacteriota bacterium]
RFEQAKNSAKSLLDQMGRSDRTALVSFGRSFNVQTRFTTEADKVRALIDDLQPTFDGTDFNQALKGVESLLQEAGKGEKTLYLISDYQGTGQTRDVEQARLTKDVKLVPIDIGEAEAPNLAVSEVGVHSVVYQQKYSDKLVARVTNFGAEDRHAVRIEFRINDHVVEKRELKIPARDTVSVEFTDFNLNEGVNRCTVDISDDAFDPDNRFYFTIRRATQLKALIIETASRGQSESFYLRNALTTGENLPFAVTVKTVGAVNPGEISEYSVILLNDAGDMNAALTGQLAKFVEAGGGLVIATGPHTRVEEFNRLLEPVAPAVLESPVLLKNDFVAMSEIKTDHPIFEVFRQSGRLSATRVFGYFRSAPREKSSVLARFEDGSPALVESAYGNGKVLLFTSTLDSLWNDLPLTPIYLPLVRQTVRHLGEREEKSSYAIGQAFTAATAKDGTPPAVDTPGGTRLTEKPQTSLGDLLINPREIGFYRLRYPGLSEYAAVNLDAKESDLRKLNPQEFVAAITGTDPAAAKDGQQPAAKITNEEVESRQRLWWLMLIGALLLFIAEGVLSRRMRTAKVIN